MIHFTMLIFATWRITMLITQDEITAKFRIWWVEKFKGTFLKDFSHCSVCVSVWAGGLSTLLFHYFPYWNWPFGLSMLTIVMMTIHNKLTVNQITIYPEQRSINYGNYEPQFAFSILNQIVSNSRKSS